jgi:hypothetical protein
MAMSFVSAWMWGTPKKTADWPISNAGGILISEFPSGRLPP